MSWASYPARPAERPRDRVGRRAWPASLRLHPELVGLLALTSVLNLWNLSVNGWANTYYSAAVRSMSTSWHDFLFASLDKTGLMTVDKPPLAFWVQALSVRVFGFHPLSILVPEALMGVVAVGLVYDLTRRMFGRVAGGVAGLAFALTPITVAVARHNNPDELLILCCVAALWCAVRALETGRTKWLVLTGVCVGLGFETKMGVALLVVPGIALAWMWTRWGDTWRARFTAARQLLYGGLAMIAVGGAWPLLVTLTPAADRPWISGTSDNSIWSLIFGYNGLGRVAGQTGGPGGGAAGPGGGGGGFGGNSLFGGATGPLRLLQSALGDQAGWLLGFAVVAGLAILVLSRLRRRDPRTGWLMAVGGAFLASAVVFSFASGIFHPYYVSFLAPFAAALVGAGVGVMLPRSLGGAAENDRAVRVIAPLAIAAGAVTELVVLGELERLARVGQAAHHRRRRRVRGDPRPEAVAETARCAARRRPGGAARGARGVGGADPRPCDQRHVPGRRAGERVDRWTGRRRSRRRLRPWRRRTRRFRVTGWRRGRPGSSARMVSPRRAGGNSVPRRSAGAFAVGGAGGFGGDSASLTAAIKYANEHGGGMIGVSSQSTPPRRSSRQTPTSPVSEASPGERAR